DPRLTWNKNSNGLLKFVLLVKDATGYTDEQMVSYETIWQAGNSKSATNSKYSASIQTYCTYYGEHGNMQELSSCVAKCLSCNEVAVPSNPVHNMATTVNYVSFAKAGEKVTKCQNADCPLNTAPATETLGALFNCLGYSAKENGVGGISIGFSLNTEAIAVYTSLTGKTLTYGVFAVSKDKLGANEIFDKGGNAASGVISAEILNKTFTVFDIKITGFTDEHKETKLAFGAYVATSDGTSTEYSYMQDDTKGALDGNYYFASYNEITAKTAQ
ncbi:MAG: hypothetical protein IJ039_09640, partial [Clostridia bacterium]|nr:hypothetical protein [Clostridia bacterium]